MTEESYTKSFRILISVIYQLSAITWNQLSAYQSLQEYKYWGILHKPKKGHIQPVMLILLFGPFSLIVILIYVNA